MVKKNPEKIVKIKSGFGKSVTLLFSEPNKVWLKDEILSLLNRKTGVPVKSSQITTVLRFENPENSEIFYFKEFHSRGLKDIIKNLFGYTRSKKDFMGGQLLLEHGFPTPAPVLRGFEKSFFLIRRNFFITKGVPGERTYQYFKSLFTRPLSAEMITEKRALLHVAGREIGRLHNAGIFHGDLRVGNMIINGRGSSAGIFFIDNERTQYSEVLPLKKRLKNLVQLNMVRLPQITGTDRLRVFNAYLMENPELLPDKKRLLREIRRMTERRLRAKT